MEYTFQELKQHLFSKVYAVYDIFKDYFGESYVDLQGLPEDEDLEDLYSTSYNEDSETYQFPVEPHISFPTKPFILVWWPVVTVTNEYGRSVDIDDLYAKISLTPQGRMPDSYQGFLLNRSTYSLLQYSSDYLHSHISGIPDSPSQFKSPCLGKGPISNTIRSLHYNEFDPITWMLFCNELAAYVTVESVSGIPYRRLERIGGNTRDDSNLQVRAYNRVLYHSDHLSLDFWKRFIIYYLKNGHLKFNYSEGAYSLGMSQYEYIIDISNSFISFYNSEFKDAPNTDYLFTEGILVRRIADGGQIFSLSQNSTANTNNVGKWVCMFKGKDINLKVYNSHGSGELNTSILLQSTAASNILQIILTILNYRYSYGSDRHETNGTGEVFTSVSETIRFI